MPKAGKFFLPKSNLYLDREAKANQRLNDRLMSNTQNTPAWRNTNEPNPTCVSDHRLSSSLRLDKLDRFYFGQCLYPNIIQKHNIYQNLQFQLSGG